MRRAITARAWLLVGGLGIVALHQAAGARARQPGREGADADERPGLPFAQAVDLDQVDVVGAAPTCRESNRS